MVGEIKKLDEATICLIACGEIYNSPVSAVKELVENSLDALASKITIRLCKGGFEKIQVIDDGAGISKEDVPGLCQRYSTSKIRCHDDLAEVETFGFRGEALSILSFTSDLEVISRVQPQRKRALKRQILELEHKALLRNWAAASKVEAPVKQEQPASPQSNGSKRDSDIGSMPGGGLADVANEQLFDATTVPKDDGQGFEATFCDGKLVSVRNCYVPNPGTTVTALNLFRSHQHRKTRKSPLNEIIEYIVDLCIAYVNVEFTLINDDPNPPLVLVSSPGASGLDEFSARKELIGTLIDRKIVEHLLPIDFGEDPEDDRDIPVRDAPVTLPTTSEPPSNPAGQSPTQSQARGPEVGRTGYPQAGGMDGQRECLVGGLSVRGLVSSVGNRVCVFVNGRRVFWSNLKLNLKKKINNILFYFLFLKINKKIIDVNIDPKKLKFSCQYETQIVNAIVKYLSDLAASSQVLLPIANTRSRPDTQMPFGTQTLCDTQMPFGTQTLCDTQTPFGTQTFCDTQTPFGTQTFCDTQTLCETQTPRNARTPRNAQTLRELRNDTISEKRNTLASHSGTTTISAKPDRTAANAQSDGISNNITSGDVIPAAAKDAITENPGDTISNIPGDAVQKNDVAGPAITDNGTATSAISENASTRTFHRTKRPPEDGSLILPPSQKRQPSGRHETLKNLSPQSSSLREQEPCFGVDQSTKYGSQPAEDRTSLQGRQRFAPYSEAATQGSDPSQESGFPSQTSFPTQDSALDWDSTQSDPFLEFSQPTQEIDQYSFDEQSHGRGSDIFRQAQAGKAAGADKSQITSNEPPAEPSTYSSQDSGPVTEPSLELDHYSADAPEKMPEPNSLELCVDQRSNHDDEDSVAQSSGTPQRESGSRPKLSEKDLTEMFLLWGEDGPEADFWNEHVSVIGFAKATVIVLAVDSSNIVLLDFTDLLSDRIKSGDFECAMCTVEPPYPVAQLLPEAHIPNWEEPITGFQIHNDAVTQIPALNNAPFPDIWVDELSALLKAAVEDGRLVTEKPRGEGQGCTRAVEEPGVEESKRGSSEESVEESGVQESGVEESKRGSTEESEPCKGQEQQVTEEGAAPTELVPYCTIGEMIFEVDWLIRTMFLSEEESWELNDFNHDRWSTLIWNEYLLPQLCNQELKLFYRDSPQSTDGPEKYDQVCLTLLTGLPKLLSAFERC